MQPHLRVAICTIGRFHMLDLARELQKLGVLERIYAGTPPWKVDPCLQGRTVTHSIGQVVVALKRRIFRLGAGTFVEDKSIENFAKWFARNLDINNVDVLDQLAGAGVAAGRLLHSRNKPWILNRGSTHICAQQAILTQEAERWGTPVPYFSEGGISRCLEEYAEADAIVVPSRFAKQSFVDRGFKPERVYVKPYGVDVSMFRPHVKRNRTFRILFVGSICLRKGIGDLLCAVKRLQRNCSIECWLVGEIQADARAILDDYRGHYEYKGTVPRAELYKVYSQCSVFVLPSIEEGLALVMAQAMACGLPVVATPNTGAEDLFSDGIEGFITPIRDPDALSARIESLISDEDLRVEMSAAAVRRVSGAGGWHRYAKECVEMYQEVIQVRARS